LRHNRRNIYFNELIGLHVKILEYPDQKLIGLEGRILDETYKSFLIETLNGRIIRVFKEHGIFQFITPQNSRFIVKGIRLVGRPEDRLKNIMR